MYILFQSVKQAEAYQAQADTLLNFPETPDRAEFQGSASWAPVELGLAQHYSPILWDADNVRIALPKVDGLTIPEGATEIAELPSDWCPPAPEMPE